MDKYSRDFREVNAENVNEGDYVEIMWDDDIGIKEVLEIDYSSGQKFVYIEYQERKVKVMADQISRIC